MDNEFDKQASKILRENLEGVGWSDEWDFDDFPPQLNLAIKEFENYLANMEDASLHDLKDIVDQIVAANVDTWGKIIDDDMKEQAIGYLKQRAEAAGLDREELYGEEGIFSGVEEDKDFHDEQRDQDPHRHEGLSDFDAEQRDQDPYRHTPDR